MTRAAIARAAMMRMDLRPRRRASFVRWYDRPLFPARDDGALARCAWRRVARAVGVLVLVALAAAVPAQAQVLNQAQDFYRTTAQSWLGPMEAIARRLFVSVAAIEIAVSGILWTLRRDSLDELAAKFLLKFVLLSFVLMLITSAAFWLKPIVNGLAAAGQSAGILGAPATPSEVVDMGTYIAFSVVSTAGVPITPDSFAALVFALFARLVVYVCFVLVAVMLVLAWVEAYVGLAGGVLFLGFGGFRATAQYAENYLNYLIYLGIRLFAVYLLLAIGTTIITSFIPPTLRATDGSTQGTVAAICVIFAVLTVRIPGNMASRVASGGSFGLANALRNL
jgi:P-type conjugative transfer protein TrbL